MITDTEIDLTIPTDNSGRSLQFLTENTLVKVDTLTDYWPNNTLLIKKLSIGSTVVIANLAVWKYGISRGYTSRKSAKYPERVNIADLPFLKIRGNNPVFSLSFGSLNWTYTRISPGLFPPRKPVQVHTYCTERHYT